MSIFPEKIFTVITNASVKRVMYNYCKMCTKKIATYENILQNELTCKDDMDHLRSKSMNQVFGNYNELMMGINNKIIRYKIHFFDPFQTFQTYNSMYTRIMKFSVNGQEERLIVNDVKHLLNTIQYKLKTLRELSELMFVNYCRPEIVRTNIDKYYRTLFEYVIISEVFRFVYRSFEFLDESRMSSYIRMVGDIMCVSEEMKDFIELLFMEPDPIVIRSCNIILNGNDFDELPPEEITTNENEPLPTLSQMGPNYNIQSVMAYNALTNDRDFDDAEYDEDEYDPDRDEVEHTNREVYGDDDDEYEEVGYDEDELDAIYADAERDNNYECDYLYQNEEDYDY